MRSRLILSLSAALTAVLIALAPVPAHAQTGQRLEPVSYEPIPCGSSCATPRIYYNQAPPSGESFGLANWYACCAGWSGSAGASNVHDTYADYTWGYPYDQGVHTVVLQDGDIVSSPFTIDFSVTQSTPIQVAPSPEFTGYQLLPCGPNCGTVRIFYDLAPPPGGWGLLNWQHFMTWSGASGPHNIHDTYADYNFYFPYVPQGPYEYVLNVDDVFSAPFTIDWSNYVPAGPTPPVTTINVTPANPNGQNGWYVTAPHVAVSATDSGSAVVDTRCELDPAATPTTFGELPDLCPYVGAGATLATDGRHTIYAASQDAVGNQETPAGSSINIDQTPPDVICSSAPVFMLNGAPSSITATVADANSGSAATTVSAPADLTTAGQKTASLTGYDNAGNAATVGCSYQVAYNFSGFQGPVSG